MNRACVLVAWLAAGMSLVAIAAPAEFSALPGDEQSLLASAQTLWPVLPPQEREQLHRNARHWLALDAPARAALTRAAAQWDRLPAPERAARRAQVADWHQLDEVERARLRAAARAFAALPLPRQQALRRQFAALPAGERDDWRLGPTLAPQMTPLRPLFEFLPAGDAAQLLALLRGLSPEARAELGTIAADLSPSRRQALRTELLAAPADARQAVVEKWAKPRA